MLSPPDEPKITGPMPSDQAAQWGFWVSIAAVMALGLSAWTGLAFGEMGCNIAGVVWLVIWTVGLGLAISGLRNSWRSFDVRRLKQRAYMAIGISVVDIVLAFLFLLAIAKLGSTG